MVEAGGQVTPEERQRTIDGLVAGAQSATYMIGVHQKETKRLAGERRKYVRQLHDLGLTTRQIGPLLGLSAPRVSQILGYGWKIRRDGDVV